MWNKNPIGRNHVLIGAWTLVAVLALGIGGKILTRDDEEDAPADTTPLPVAPRAGRTIEHRAIGATIRKPRRWAHQRAGRSLTLRSPDRSVIMSIALPPGTDRSARVLESGVQELRRQYRAVKVIGTDTREVARLPTNSIITTATNVRGAKLRVLTSAPQGRKRAWLVQIFSAEGTKERRLAEAQVAVGTLRLSG